MKTIAALLTVHNRKEKTLSCLHKLFEQNSIDDHQLDVYLTDDGCTDGTIEAVSKQYPSINIIHGTGNLFWNRGMHLAWKTASRTNDYDFYLWLNDDTIMEQNALSTLLKTSAKFNNEAIIVGTTTALNNHQEITYGGRNRKGNLLEPSDKPIRCNFFNGNIVLFPRYVYKKVGLNDPFFHHALGDFDYGFRASRAGIKSIVAPSTLGQCDEHNERPTWCNPQKAFKQRWKTFRSPLGQNPEEFFIFEFRHNGLPKACFHYLTNHLRVLYPSLWNHK